MNWRAVARKILRKNKYEIYSKQGGNRPEVSKVQPISQIWLQTDFALSMVDSLSEQFQQRLCGPQA